MRVGAGSGVMGMALIAPQNENFFINKGGVAARNLNAREDYKSLRCLCAFLVIAIVTGCNTKPMARWEGSLAEEKIVLQRNIPFTIESDKYREGDLLAKPGDMKIYPNSRFCVVGFVDPSLKPVFEPNTSDKYSAPVHAFGGFSTEAEKKYHISYGTLDDPDAGRGMGAFSNDTDYLREWEKYCPNNGINIYFTYSVSSNAKKLPYKITLTARQGRFFWSRSVERPNYEREGKGKPGGIYPVKGQNWNPDHDGYMLNKQFETFFFAE